jgi:hypothetical protein
VDDLGFGDLGYAGSGIATPHLDRLRAEGVELTSFYAQPICTPTRGSFLTSRYALLLGLQGRATVQQGQAWGLDLGEQTFVSALQGSGWATHMVGKVRRIPPSLSAGLACFDCIVAHAVLPRRICVAAPSGCRNFAPPRPAAPRPGSPGSRAGRQCSIRVGRRRLGVVGHSFRVATSRAYGPYLGCSRAPIKRRIRSWIQPSHRRRGVEPNGSMNGSVPLWKRRGVACLAPDRERHEGLDR